MPRRYILRSKDTGEYVGRGVGNDSVSYGLHKKPSQEDWRNSQDLCQLEAMNWQAQAKRLKLDCPEFDIVESSF